MSKTKTLTAKYCKRPSILYLLLIWLLGTICLSFSQGHYPSPLLAIVAIASWLWCFRRFNLWSAVGCVVVGNVVAWEIAFRGMVPMPTSVRLGMELAVSILFAIAFLVDRFTFSARANARYRWWRSMVFPCGWVAYELLCARLSPGGTWGSIAYAYVGRSPLDQVGAWVGWTGLTFLSGWLAVLFCNLWEGSIPLRRRLRMTAAGLCAVVTLSLLGQVRRHSGAVELPVSLVVAPDTYHYGQHFNEVWSYTRGVKQSSADERKAVEQLDATLQRHVQIFREEASTGSKLIVTAEVNASITNHEESQWVSAAAQVAKEFRAYIGLGLMVFHTEGELFSENKFVLIDPEGNVLTDYLKRTKPPGVSHVVGSGAPPVLTTEFGKWMPAICFDLDFPQLIARSAGAASLIIAPSNDWTEAAQTHARMAHMRAIENGCCLIRPTKDGISTVVDSCGRQLGWQETDQAPTSTLRSRVRVGRSWALYPLIGDFFAWACSLFWLTSITLCLFAHKTRDWDSHLP